MLELRRNPRITVNWRGFVRLSDGHLMPIRAHNVSETGLMIASPQSMVIKKQYQMMLEIPNIDRSDDPPYKVPLSAVVSHCVLSGDAFRIGVEFVDLASLHRDLIAAWVSITSKYDPD